jgi:tetratricopeptide (TPR) repeat protein
VMNLLHKGQRKEALAKATAWYDGAPGEVLALVAIGEAAESTGDLPLAARAYGSIIDLFPGRADLRRFAGNRLERVHAADATALAIDTYRKAVEQRPDHPASHRLLAFALLKAGRPAEAFDVLAAGLHRPYPAGRFAGVTQILAEDLGLIAAAWSHAEPQRAAEIRQRLEKSGGRLEDGPSLRFVLTWETDANDVDFHIHDGRGGHAFYSARQLPSGGELYADVTTGYGPECFTIRAPAAARAYPYRLQAHYYSRGPMGYGMGKLQIIEHDGRGGLRFEERPFVVMRDQAFVEMGTVAR